MSVIIADKVKFLEEHSILFVMFVYGMNITFGHGGPLNYGTKQRNIVERREFKILEGNLWPPWKVGPIPPHLVEGGLFSKCGRMKRSKRAKQLPHRSKRLLHTWTVQERRTITRGRGMRTVAYIQGKFFTIWGSNFSSHSNLPPLDLPVNFFYTTDFTIDIEQRLQPIYIKMRY